MKKTEEMKKYEIETGKKAIWRGIITENFKKWKRGEKVYEKAKERINILVSEKKKNKWQGFANNNNISTISKLIRKSVDNYIENFSKKVDSRNFYNKAHKIKEKLSIIMGFSQMLIEHYKDQLDFEILLKIKEIYDKGSDIEKILNEILDSDEIDQSLYDILIIDDDVSTNTLLAEFFSKKGFICKEVISGNRALTLLKHTEPKLILLDILLPDNSGYEICKKIKSNERLKNIPVFFITAVPESEVFQKYKKTGANGYFLKPFKLDKFNGLLEYL